VSHRSARDVLKRTCRVEDPKPIFDGQARSADQKAAGEISASLASRRIDRLPCDEHGHDGGLACAGGEFQREPHQLRIGVFIRRSEMIQHTFAPVRLRGNLREPDRRFCGFDLAEERADAAERVLTPMLQKAGGLRRDLPLTGAQLTPCVHIAADLVDNRGRIVLLLLRREALAFVEHKSRLGGGLALLGLGDRRDEFGTAPALDDLLSGLARLIQFPMPPRGVIRRIQNRMIEEGVRHIGSRRRYEDRW
jgi:hypothetical protein